MLRYSPGLAVILLSLTPASAQQAPDSDAPLDHLSTLSKMNSHVSKTFDGNSMYAAQQLASGEFKELPSFVSQQTVRRGIKMPDETEVSGIDQVKLEVSIEPSGKNQVKEVPVIKEYGNDDQKYGPETPADQLLDLYKQSPGLQVSGVYAGSMTTPFQGGLPKLLKNPDPKLVKAGPAGALIYTFDTAGKKPMAIGIPAVDGQPAQPDENIDVKGYAYFDKKGQLLKMIMNGYGMVRVAHYLHEEISFAPTKIEGLEGKTYWLPDTSEVEMGESAKDYRVNYTTYDKYQQFVGTGTVGAGTVDDDDNDSKTQTPPTPKKPQ